MYASPFDKGNWHGLDFFLKLELMSMDSLCCYLVFPACAK